MLTEVDTRHTPDGQVSLFMDTDEQVYLVCVEGHEPIICQTRDGALQAYRHPFAHIPLQGHRSRSNGLVGVDPTPLTSGEELSYRTADALIDLRNVLAEMNVADFEWTASSVLSMIDSLRRWFHEDHITGPPPDPRKPYDQEGDIEF